MKNKIKNLFNKIKNIKLSKKNKLILLGIIIVFFLTLGVLLFVINYNKISDIEKLKLTEVSNKVSPYLENVENNIEDNITMDRYISFALDYSVNENNKNEISTDEVVEIISNVFNIKIDGEKLRTTGISPYMLEKNITYDSMSDKFKIDNDSLTNSQIAEIRVYKYELSKIVKKKKNIFEITYNKYEVSNPYEVLNYYNDKNNNIDIDHYDKDGKKIESKDNYKFVDTTPILNYLTGKGDVATFRKYITKDNIEKVGSIKKQVKVSYMFVNDKVLIDSIK